MSKHLNTAIILSISLLLLFGCATERYISPTILDPPRVGLELNPPILCSVYDGRAEQLPPNASLTLQEDLERIYGSSIEWSDYFSKTPSGRVAIRIRIVTLGSSFGSRLVSTMAFSSAVNSAQGSATGTWGSIIGNVSEYQSILTGSVSGEGWWNGAAWIDLELEDHRRDNKIVFILPIISEHREFNMWGTSSGDRAALIAWQKTSVQLTRAMDAIFRAVRDQQ